MRRTSSRIERSDAPQAHGARRRRRGQRLGKECSDQERRKLTRPWWTHVGSTTTTPLEAGHASLVLADDAINGICGRRWRGGSCPMTNWTTYSGVQPSPRAFPSMQGFRAVREYSDVPAGGAKRLHAGARRRLRACALQETAGGAGASRQPCFALAPHLTGPSGAVPRGPSRGGRDFKPSKQSNSAQALGCMPDLRESVLSSPRRAVYAHAEREVVLLSMRHERQLGSFQDPRTQVP